MTGNIFNITDNIKYIGVDDHSLDLFENQYRVKEGICYNSYLIKGEKTAVMDTTDDRTGEEWLSNLRQALGDARPDYLIIEHMEPDHSSLISTFMEIYPEAKLVMSAVAAKMLPQYMDPLPANTEILTMKDGDLLDLGGISLTFHTAPMVHWPEVMMAYCPEHKLLFSADAFGTFGVMDTPREEWAKEARRYYYNIVGKFGQQVQNVLKKLSKLDIETICPLHGPVLTGDLSMYFSYYDTWSLYRPETDGVFIACASIHGNTLDAANYLAELLRKNGEKVYVSDLTHDDLSEMLAEAFKYPKAVFCASSYDAGLFTPMYSFLHILQAKGYKDRTVALIENGSWAPTAGKVMRSMLEDMKNIDFMGYTITIHGAFKQTDRPALDALADGLIR
ncbi:MAG: FprA family A-type flavoprotein [Muribaculum sp.]|nr:FprA family A-type flavoprotein [Muribaculum sp.]